MRYVLEPIDIAPVQIRNFYPYPPPPVSSKNNHNNFGGKTLLWRPPDIRKLRKCFDGAWTTSSLSYFDLRHKNIFILWAGKDRSDLDNTFLTRIETVLLSATAVQPHGDRI